MSDNKNHIIFTAVDIEKYHKGQLSAKERHDLEKAALDDLFLADALEGYAVSGVNAGADIVELQKRLSERANNTKVIPIYTARGNSSFPWLKVAAIIIVMSGAGLLTYQFVFNKRSKNIAQAASKKTDEMISTDSNHTVSAITDTENKTDSSITVQLSQNNSHQEKSNPVIITNHSVGAGVIKRDTMVIDGYSSSPKKQVTVNPAPANPPDKITEGLVTNDSGKKELAEEKALLMNDDSSKDKPNTSHSQSDSGNKELVAMNRAAGNPNISSTSSSLSFNRMAENQIRNNIFRGRVIDANNNPVPFANITNTRDEAGTYSDANGYFNLISPDSVLNVEIRSVGFENNNIQLSNNVNNSQVVMQEDNRNLAEVIVANKKSNAALRAHNASLKLEEPEPVDGWANYDIYLANNLTIPDEKKTNRGTGDVEVSLEVDKNGKPINIKVEKSLCDQCDLEAIRLIKEGPKWKRRNRKSRATVTIPF